MKTFTYVLLISFISIVSAKAQTTILTENFTKGTLPSGWSVTKNPSNPVGWQIGNRTSALEIYNGTDTLFAPETRGNFAMDLDFNNDPNGYGTTDRLITPAVDLSSYTTVYVKFNAYFEEYENSSTYAVESLTLEASTDGGSSWTPVQSVPVSLDEWQDVYANVSAYAGKSGVQFAFLYDDDGSQVVGAAVGNVVIFSPAFIPQHAVTFEEATGMWCGFCVRGIVYQDSIEKVYPNSAITISVHDGDAFVTDAVANYNYATELFMTPYYDGQSFPTIEINRLNIDDPADVFTQYANHKNDFGVANLSVNPSYDEATRLATINVNGNFATGTDSSTAYGAYTYALVITEDSVMGNSTSYDQANYYSDSYEGLQLGPMGDFNSLPEQVPYTQMYYMYVAEAILNDYAGTAGSLPATIAAGSNEPHKYTYTVPETSNAAHIHANLLLIDGSTGNILNATSSPLIATGISVLNSGVADVNVFPNPVYNNANVSVSLSKTEHVVIILNDILGRTIASTDEGTLPSGVHNFVYNASSLASGIYLMTIKTEDGQLTRKIVKQ